jgi:hypothetical protein
MTYGEKAYVLYIRQGVDGADKEPKEYWIYEEGQHKKMLGRRPVGYYFRCQILENILGRNN